MAGSRKNDSMSSDAQDDDEVYLVCGASGRVGGEVAGGLRSLRRLVVTTTRRPESVAAGVAELDWQRPETWEPALGRAHRVFLVPR